MDSTDGQISSFGYSFYTANEIRTISVIEITSDAAFDRFTNRGVDGGLHDMALGPCSERDICAHCGLDYLQCPGHIGHIEFAKAVYNPMFMNLVLRLLKSFCFSCFKICNVEILSASLELLGLPEILLPSKPKLSELEECKSLPTSELRRTAIRAMSMRPRIPCRNCSSKAWVSRHINNQQIVMRPVSDLRNARFKSGVNSQGDEGNADHEPGELESWAAIEAQLLGDKAVAHPVVTFEEGYAISDGADFDDMSENVREQLESLASNNKETFASTELVRDMLRCFWMQNRSLLRILLPSLHTASAKYKYATDIFFMEVMPVSPSFCRWPRVIAGMAYEHPATAIFSKVIKRAIALRQIIEFIQEMNLKPSSSANVGGRGSRSASLRAGQESDMAGHKIASSSGPMTTERANAALHVSMVFLQAAVNAVYDMNTSVVPAGFESRNETNILLPGLKQRLEKKQGLFRMNMMGKRVNYACRSVISPDPNLRVYEVGVPLFIARKLTFPEPVNEYNIEKLRKLIAVGPDTYPGACSIQMADGHKIVIPATDSEFSIKRRQMLANRITTPQNNVNGGLPTIVNRHLEDGDFLIMNRQPSLHRPSMQAHCVRIIKAPGAKTLRLHYAICKAYNADFDGDEMNGHCPQTYQAKAEMSELAAVPYQYLAPKDGSPLGGLIQDHVIAAVKLTIRDRFLDHDEYLDLVYAALYASVADANGSLPEVLLVKPAILYPTRLWTGKQVFTTLFLNITPPGLPHLNAHIVGKKAKTELWAGAPFARAKILSDVDLVICGGYLASGMLEKAHIGSASGGLVHCTYEAYGAKAASQLLSGISRLADRFLKIGSFTMSLADIALSAKADKDRKRRFQGIGDLGLCAFADAFGLKPEELSDAMVKTLYRRAQFASKFDEVYGGKLMALDCAVKDRIKRSQDAVCDAAIPAGLYTPFPLNSLQLMVHVGAKGGMVNAQQMSVALGQIELEGKRVPLMLSGRSLPSFPPYDVRPRAGGMCTHRFLTSMPPQELFFHSMAGRDGLIDTACKTSRSGYLQRSLIKHLEDLSVQYDGTVRDSGGSVIQFRYGEDGLDVCQSSFLKPTGIHFFADNAELLSERWRCPTDPTTYQEMTEKNPLSPDLAKQVDEVAVKRLNILLKSPSAKKLSLLHKRRERASERLKNPEIMATTSINGIRLPVAPCRLAEDLRAVVTAKIIQGQVPAGEPVGLLAAQSIGEPSTQMTLNTFHFAGRGEVNVTLGIPRLREVLMSGSANIATPTMEAPVLNNPIARAKIEFIARSMYKLRLAEVLKLPLGIEVDYASDSCSITFHLQPPSTYESRTNVRPQRIIKFFERVLFPDLAKRLETELRDQGKSAQIKSFTLKALARQKQSQFKNAEDGNDADDDDANFKPKTTTGRDEWNEDDGAEAIRRRRLEGEDETEGVGGGDIDLDEDDDEAAELREIGVDPEAVKTKDENSKWVWNGDNLDATSTSKKETPRSTAVADEKKGGIPKTSEEQGEIENPDVDRAEDEEMEELILQPDDKFVDTTETIMNPLRVEFVKGLHLRFNDYAYDTRPSPSWVRLSICMFDPKEGRISIDLRTLVQRIINRSVVSSVPNIHKGFIDKTNSKEWMFRVEGVNIPELMRHADVFDLNKLYTNHVHLMQQYYGIEAARGCLQKEISGVFGHYGIHVDPRHLCLVADYLTKTGIYRAFNRRTMDFHPSPMQRVTFETATGVLKSVIQENLVESTISPSGSIVAGQLTHGFGTTCFDLLTKLCI